MLWKRTCLRAASPEAIIAVSIVTFASGDANTVINGVLLDFQLQRNASQTQCNMLH